MLTIKERGILINITKHCEKINEKIRLISKEEFDRNEDIVQIICFNILQIGELAKNLDSNFINRYNSVPWRQIKGMRDKVAHGYGTIDMDRIWQTALSDIMPLLDYCEKILNGN